MGSAMPAGRCWRRSRAVLRGARLLPLRSSATATAPALEPPEGSAAPSPARPPLQPLPPPLVDFADAREAFRSKSSAELARGLLVLGLCSLGPLVDHAGQLINLSRKLLGQQLFEKLMKATFYGQFVAGENQEAIKPLIQHNQAHGVGSVLDYSVEEDMTTEEAAKKELEK